jgi:hypothetical protein
MNKLTPAEVTKFSIDFNGLKLVLCNQERTLNEIWTYINSPYSKLFSVFPGYLVVFHCTEGNKSLVIDHMYHIGTDSDTIIELIKMIAE